MVEINYLKDRFEQLQAADPRSEIAGIRLAGYDAFNKAGIPTLRNEEWKYTSVASLFEKEYRLEGKDETSAIDLSDIDKIRLPGHEEANELVFINGLFKPSLSNIRSPESQLAVLPLDAAAGGIYKEIIKEYLGHSSHYVKDGIHALNTSFIQAGVFIHVSKAREPERPVYIYYLTDSRTQHTLSQPRSLIYVDDEAKLQLAETYHSLGTSDSFTNQVMEIVVNENAFVECYKIQADSSTASQVNTTHIRQIKRSYVHAVTISLSGNMVRNNLNLLLEAAGNESHLYGLYLLKGRSHVDNHTLVDNIEPNCFSNQLYKGIGDDFSTGVFNGKIMVQRRAQKTNAYQSNKNILLSDHAGINAKPQLEIFADDVKCSHGCTVGQLDENALFYLRARGIPEATARVLLLQAFAADIVEQVKPEILRKHVKELIHERLSIK